MNLTRLSVADYNKLDNIPVINQDLSASGFTPVTNTYYKHTGETTDTFTQGVIYLYDTSYHKLGESGGTTLNKYTFTVSTKPSVAQTTQILNILNSAVRILGVNIQLKEGLYGFMTQDLSEHKYIGQSINTYSNIYTVYNVLLRDDLGTSGIIAYKTNFTDSAFSTTETTMSNIKITYLNSTEII